MLRSGWHILLAVHCPSIDGSCAECYAINIPTLVATVEPPFRRDGRGRLYVTPSLVVQHKAVFRVHFMNFSNQDLM